VFITTSSYTAEATEFADSVTPRVILVDGRELARLMIEYGVGVTTINVYEIKRSDTDYFTTDVT
jgi:restriction system protein